MADINHVVLIGRLTRDSELRYTANGTPICKFAIAINKRRKQGEQWIEEASFFDIVLWGRPGEALNQYLVKGKQVAVQGELNQNRWEQDGQTKSKVEIIASSVQLLGGNFGQTQGSSYGSKNFQQETSPSTQEPAAFQRKTTSEASNNLNQMDSDFSDFPDDIPF